MPYLSSRSIYKPIKNLFVGPDEEVNAILMRLFVLCEDLRVEVYGAQAQKLEKMDETSSIYRGVYMMRRSTVTINEFTQSMERLEQLPAFKELKDTFSERNRFAWDRTKEFLLEHKEFLSAIRHNCGGHILAKKVRKAMERMHQDTTGFVRVNYVRNELASINFGFAFEVVALLMDVERPETDDPQPYTKKLFKVITKSWEHIIDCMHALANQLIVPRFHL